MKRADPDALRLTARSLRIDRVTAEVVGALRVAGIPTLLIKGPLLAQRLYRDGASRPYGDSDLLVEPGRFDRAEQLLAARGFVRVGEEERSLPEWARHGHELMRPEEEICVELHWTLMHYGARPEHVWQAFNRDSARLRVSGLFVDVPGDPQIALHVAVHVAEHGLMALPAEDLARALECFGFDTWAAAARMARELDAIAAFAAGLRMLEPGRQLAGRLGLGHGGVAAFSLERVSRAPRWRAKAGVAVRIAFPAPEYMRSFGRPLANLGRVGLVAAYAWRPLELAARSPGALLAHRRARRSERNGH